MSPADLDGTVKLLDSFWVVMTLGPQISQSSNQLILIVVIWWVSRFNAGNVHLGFLVNRSNCIPIIAGSKNFIDLNQLYFFLAGLSTVLCAARYAERCGRCVGAAGRDLCWVIAPTERPL